MRSLWPPALGYFLNRAKNLNLGTFNLGNLFLDRMDLLAEKFYILLRGRLEIQAAGDRSFLAGSWTVWYWHTGYERITIRWARMSRKG
jgi:hypothetical protein